MNKFWKIFDTVDIKGYNTTKLRNSQNCRRACRTKNRWRGKGIPYKHVLKKENLLILRRMTFSLPVRCEGSVALDDVSAARPMWRFCCVGWCIRFTVDVKTFRYEVCVPSEMWSLRCRTSDMRSFLLQRCEVFVAPWMWSLCCSTDVKSLLLHGCEVFIAPRMWSLCCSTDVKSLLLHGCEVFVAPRMWSLRCASFVEGRFLRQRWFWLRKDFTYVCCSRLSSELYVSCAAVMFSFVGWMVTCSCALARKRKRNAVKVM